MTECPMDCEKLELSCPRLTLSKEELRESSSCRLCGLGASLKTNTASSSFLPLFELAQALHQHLNVLINRYLPIKVFESDEYFPRFVCSVCVQDLEQTIDFFDRVAAGQRLLLQIIHTQPHQPQPPSFSAENPISLATPRRRGRPKKDPNQPPKEKPALPVEDLGKPKRSIRVPGRYGAADSTQSSTPEADRNAESDQGFRVPPSKVKNRSLPLDPLDSASEKSEFVGLSIVDPNPTAADEAEFSALKAELQPDSRSDVPVVESHADSRTGDDPNDLDCVVQGNKIKLKRGRGRPRKRGRKAKSKKMIECPLCQKVFGHPSSLRYHRVTAHAAANAATFSCELCPRVFKHKNLLKCHMLAHSDKRDFRCTHCPKKFKSRASLDTHVQVIHVGVKYGCEECGLLMSFKSSLAAHMRLHRGEKPFVCEFCHKAFTQKSNLDEHLRVHTNDRPYQCSVCFKTFKTCSQHKNHEMTHQAEKSFLCSTCGKSFSNRMHFKYHLRRHTGEAPVECKLCSRRFVEPYALTKHMRTHTGSQPYHCIICNRKFGDGSNFHKHMKRHGTYSTTTQTQLRPPGAPAEKARPRPVPRPPKLQGRVLELLNKSTLEASSEEIRESGTSEAASTELQSGQVVEFFMRPGTSQGNSDTRQRRSLKTSVALSEEQIQIQEGFAPEMEAADPDSDTSHFHGAEVLGEDEEGSLVQILDAEGLLESEDGQVIYVYPDDLPIFTITLNDDHQPIQVRGNEEATLQTLSQLSGRPLTFTTVDGTELGTQYFNLQTVDGSTLISHTLSDPSQSSSDANDLHSSISLGPLLIPHSEAEEQALSPSNSNTEQS